MPSGIELTQFSVRHADKPWSIADVALTIEDGHVAGILGGNGAGKSTLAQGVMGIIPQLIPGAVEGRALVRGARLDNLSLAQRLRHIQLTFQDTESQVLFGTVRDCLELYGATTWPLVREAIELLNVEPLLNRPVECLSTGQLQRVMLCTALRQPVSALIYDEATSALDPCARRDFAHLLCRLKDEGHAVMLLGQRASILSPYCDELMVVHEGRLAPQQESAHQDQCQRFPAIPNQIAPPRCFLEDLVIKRSRDFFVGPINITIGSGEVIALLGPNGSGKSSLLGGLSGSLPIDSGLTYLEGRAYHRKNWRYLAERTRVVTTSPAAQLLGATIAEEFDLSDASGSGSQRIDDVRAVFPFLEPSRDPLDLSFGQMRLLNCVVAMHGASVLVFDEPELGMDDDNLRMIQEWIQRTRNERSCTVVMSTHDYDVASWADRCLIMRDGTIMSEHKNGSASSIAEWYVRHT